MSLHPILAGALLVAIAASAALAGPRKTDHDSLLFSSAALALIDAARRGEDSPRNAEQAAAAPIGRAAAPPAIHLSAIVYHAPDEWRIWLNGQSFTPASAPGRIEILAVTAGTVRLAWHGEPARRFDLQPNQTYLVASGRTVEGRLPWRGARR